MFRLGTKVRQIMTQNIHGTVRLTLYNNQNSLSKITFKKFFLRERANQSHFNFTNSLSSVS